MKNHLIVYIHGKGGSAAEAEHYKTLFKDADTAGFDYTSQTPWEACEEFPEFFDSHRKNYNTVTLIANSIGAFLSMNALSEKHIDSALFISPVVNMERLIEDMMKRANVTEALLSTEKEIATGFGETLSWEYLCYVRNHPLKWNIPTRILYGENDNLTSIETITDFAERINAPLTVMNGGEHWFHTEQQMQFLDNWIKSTSDSAGNFR